jgi:hypothetical protein
MAAPELIAPPARHGRLARAAFGAWLTAYVAIWLATLGAAALLAAAGGTLTDTTRHVLALRLSPAVNPPPSLERVLGLALHNFPIAAWPLLLGAVGAERHALGRRIGDIAVIGWMAANTLPVGAALGAYGTGLLPYLPHLPLEWAGLALGASGWALQRRQPLERAEAVVLLGVLASMLICAASVEVLATPHRKRADSICQNCARRDQAAARPRAPTRCPRTTSRRKPQIAYFGYAPRLGRSSTGQG